MGGLERAVAGEEAAVASGLEGGGSESGAADGGT